MEREFEIVRVREYFEVRLNGKFFCTADTEAEAESEIEKEMNKAS